MISLERETEEERRARYDAMRLADEHGLTPEQTETTMRALLHERYLERIRPFLNEKAKILMFDEALHGKQYVRQDGMYVVVPQVPSAETSRLLELLDRLIAIEAEAFGAANPAADTAQQAP